MNFFVIKKFLLFHGESMDLDIIVFVCRYPSSAGLVASGFTEVTCSLPLDSDNRV